MSLILNVPNLNGSGERIPIRVSLFARSLRKEADVLCRLIPEQVINELSSATWPRLLSSASFRLRSPASSPFF
jgi:hypothetical protein